MVKKSFVYLNVNVETGVCMFFGGYILFVNEAPALLARFRPKASAECKQSVHVNALPTLHPPFSQNAFYMQSVYRMAQTVHARTAKSRVRE